MKTFLKRFLKSNKAEKRHSCKHENAYFFHENAPMYCPDCQKYIDGNKVI